MSITPSTSSVRVTLPSWLWGGNPKALMAECDLRVRNGAADEYFVQTQESYEHRVRPGLVSVRTLAGPGSEDRLDFLASRVEGVDPPMHPDMLTILERHEIKAKSSGELLDMFNHLRLATYVIDIPQLPEQARSFLDAMTSAALVGEPDNHPFENAGVQYIEVSSALMHRLKLASVWLRIEHDPLLAAGDISHLASCDAKEASFASSQGLYSGIYMLDAYLGPLLACLTPGVWAIQVQRTFGNLIFTLGRPISGTFGEAVEPLQLITVQGAHDRVRMPQLRAHGSISAVQLWVELLDQMFGVISDMAVYADRSGRYQAPLQLHAMLTVEQVFRRTTSLLVAHRDTNARRALAFTVLDSLNRLTSVDFDRMCTLSYAEATLQRIESEITGEAADVLLPVARRGVQALRDMQNGFFIARQLNLSGLDLGGGKRAATLEVGVAQYLKVLRDATHGHGAIASNKVEPTNRLLAHHDGEVPHDIGLLAYLYLLDVVCRPDRLRAVLQSQSRRNGL